MINIHRDSFPDHLTLLNFKAKSRIGATSNRQEIMVIPIKSKALTSNGSKNVEVSIMALAGVGSPTKLSV